MMSTQPFNSGWEFRPKVNLFSEMVGPKTAFIPVELPHDAMLSGTRSPEVVNGGANAYFPGGVFEYRKTFDVPEEYRSKRVSLEFGGAYRDAVVFVNGEFAGQRPNGYSTFCVNLDPYLTYGDENTLTVETRTHDDSRWYPGGGLHRGVEITVTELTHFARYGIRIVTPDVDASRAVVTIDTTIENESVNTAATFVRTEVLDPSGAVSATDIAPVTVISRETATLRQRMVVSSPLLWNVDSPSLYRLRSTLLIDGVVVHEVDTDFGIRTVQVDAERGLRINGESVKLRGACIHHDNGPLGAASYERAEERRIERLKAAGFNAIRSAHNPMSVQMLRACDRIGMLVMDETFDMWTESKTPFDYSLAFPEWWERDVQEMVLKDFNHPSVVMYSIGNEIPETGSGLGSVWGRRLVDKVRSLDHTRPITNGINGMVSVIEDLGRFLPDAEADQTGVNSAMDGIGDLMNIVGGSDLVTERTAEAFSQLDVAGMNYTEIRYQADKKRFPHRVIVGTETFPTAIDTNWKLVTENDHVIGDFTWTGWDYLGETGIGRLKYRQPGETAPEFASPYPWIAAWCADIDLIGDRRPASFYREIVFGLRAEPFIAVHDPSHHGEATWPARWAWSDSLPSWTWRAEPGSATYIDIYSASDEVELIRNGTSIGRLPTGEENRFTARFETTYAPGVLEAIAYTDGQVVGRHRIATAKGSPRLAIAVDREVIAAAGEDLAFVEISIVDDAGTLWTSDDRDVTVHVDGPGRLVALASAAPSTDIPYSSATTSTFGGRALAIVRPTAPGTITVFASAPGLEGMQATCVVR
jgi:beta-galactosidase